MCYMVVVALPSAAQQKRLSYLPEGIYSWPSVYPGLSVRMKHWQPVIVGTSGCSCDLFLPQSDAKTRNLRRKYEKQGWSQAKIERAMADHGPTGFPGNLHPGLRHWLAESAQEAGEAFLIVHWDSARLEAPDAIRLSVFEFQDPNRQIAEEQLYHLQANVTNTTDGEERGDG